MLLRHSAASALFLSVVVACWAAACGSGDDTSGTPPGGTPDGGGTHADAPPVFGDSGSLGKPLASLAFNPPAASVLVTGSGPKTASYTLVATFTDGSMQTVTPNAVQFDRPDLASLAAGPPVALTAAGPYAGVGTLHGIYQGKEATATLTVQMQVTYVAPGVPPGAVAGLGGSGLPPDPALSSLLYPYDKTVFPLGVT
jgi:hypothetical protein